MNKVAIGFLTKDKPELTRRSIKSLLDHDFDVFWIDGSKSDSPGFATHISHGLRRGIKQIHAYVEGGSDAAIVCALTAMLACPEYAYVGLCEQDVLLDPDWYIPTMALFHRGYVDGLEVGAVSARSYEDRILIQRDRYGIMHNLGAGQIIFTRQAAQIILDNYRTGWTTENRNIFVQLTGIDIGGFWAFRGGEHPITADWSWDAILAKHGLASLALTPSLATMLDQDIAAQGLKMARLSAGERVNEEAFDAFRNNTASIREGAWMPGGGGNRVLALSGGVSIFPHQIPGIGGIYSGDWRLVNSQGWGPFGWRAGMGITATWGQRGIEQASHGKLIVPILGPCEFTVQGPGRFRVTDEHSGYQIAPDLPAAGGLNQLVVPSGVSYRNVRLEALTPGCTFHGIQCRETQPWLSSFKFDYGSLPPACALTCRV